MLAVAALVDLFACWIAFGLAFWRPRAAARERRTVTRASVSRLGIAFVSAAFALAWVYVNPDQLQRPRAELIFSMILGPVSAALAWWAARHLGKQWRYEAAIREDHELIRTGPYRWMRHPIYASMFGMLLATGAAWSWWPTLIAAVILYVIGTEIRIRAEEQLLSERFGADWEEYRLRVRAWIPLIR